MSSELAGLIVRLDEDGVMAIVQSRVARGDDPMSVIAECKEGMELVGEQFRTGEFFLSELILSAEIFKSAMAELEPLLRQGSATSTIGKVVLGTPKGDIHDIGKDIFAVLMRANGFEVLDLGVDVPAPRFVEAARDSNARIVAMSGLITPSFDGMKEVVQGLEQAGLRSTTRVIIGGGVTSEVARRFVGADAQTIDAIQGIDICKKWVYDS